MAPKTKAAEIKAIKKLPWPKGLKEGALSVQDGYRTGQLIRDKIGAGRGGDSKVSVIEVVKLLGSSTSTIYRALMVYDVVTEYKLEKSLETLPATLLYNIPRLPPNQRTAFLKKALKEKWSKREITRQAAAKDPKSRKSPSRRTPARNPDIAAELKKLERVVKVTDVAKANLAQKDLTKAEISAAKKGIRSVQKFLKKWEKTLK